MQLLIFSMLAVSVSNTWRMNTVSREAEKIWTKYIIRLDIWPVFFLYL